MIVACPGCGKKYQAGADSAGKRFRCAQCGAEICTITSRDGVATTYGGKGHYLFTARGHLRLEEGTEFVFGRDISCTYLLEDPRVSRRHATLKWNGVVFLLADLDSRNGTFLEGRRIHGAAPLNDGESFQLGNEVFTYRVVSDEEELRRAVAESRRNLSMKRTEELPSLASALPDADFSGSLDNMSASEICQILALGRRSGRLLIVGGDRAKYVLQFEKGEIIFADCGSALGDAAVLRTLQLREGVFSLDSGARVTERNVAQNIGYFLLEAARRADEKR